MDQSQMEHIAATEGFVKDSLHGADGSHDWLHIVRVRHMAERIAAEEGADSYVIALAVLLHDIADHKYHGGDMEIGPRKAREWLKKIGVPDDVAAQVVEIVATLSFSGSHGAARMRTKEGSVVRDADRLDAIGAIGIARAFTHGGSKNHALYDPEIPPSAVAGTMTLPIANHFYEKLFLVKDRMETAAGARIAAERHAFMEAFMERFWRECGGEA